MAKKKEDQVLPLHLEDDMEPSSSITYANEVIAIIAGLAASEVEGVAGMCSVNNGLKSKNKNATRGVKVEVGSEEVSVDIYLNVEYGTPIQRAAHDVQEGVKKGIESMTGLHVVRVDVHVQGVSFEKENNALQAGAGKAVLEAGEKTQEKLSEKAEKLSEKAEKPVLAPEIPEEPIVPVQAEENPEETGEPSGAMTEEIPEEGMEDILSEETKTDE